MEIHESTLLASIKKNLVMWIIIFSCILVLSYDSNILGGFLTFFAMLFFSHLFHFACHWEWVYPFNSTHLLHHKESKYNKVFPQLVLEFCSFLFIILLKEGLIQNFDWQFLKIINNWVILFYYIFYTTVHNVNYSIFHVNDVHEIHHKNVYLNLGPDICDIIFNTKSNPEEGVEDTTHYIPNSLVATILTLVIKYFWDLGSDYESWIKKGFVNLYVFMASLLVLLTIICFLEDKGYIFCEK